jgi:CRP-like cAMP-binding protein
MYDIIRGLPVFNGISAEQLSDFLERTKIEFCNYQDGEKIVAKAEPMTHVKFVINGAAQMQIPLADGRITVHQTLPPGSMILPEYLWGLTPYAPVNISAKGKTSILKFPKGQFEEQLKINHLCLLNTLNYLSYRAQSRLASADAIAFESPMERWLAMAVMSLTDRRGVDIVIEVTPETLCDRLGVKSKDDVIEQLSHLQQQGKISFTPTAIRVLNRKDYF